MLETTIKVSFFSLHTYILQLCTPWFSISVDVDLLATESVVEKLLDSTDTELGEM